MASTAQVPSRTADGKHPKRFIIEVLITGRFSRSGNHGLTGYFATRKEAQAVLASGRYNGPDLTYRVRQIRGIKRKIARLST